MDSDDLSLENLICEQLQELETDKLTFTDEDDLKIIPPVSKVRRPGNGFIRFSNEKRREIAIMFPKYENREVSTLLGRMWKKMTPKEKKPYQDGFKEDMNKLREKHPEWNYAGSRSKDRPSKIEDDKILDQRLRPRQEVAHVTYNKSEYELTKQVKRSRKRESTKTNKKNSRTSMTLWIECDLCKKWRTLPPNTDQASLPSKWCCYMNSNQMFNSCSAPEERDE